MRKTPKTSHAQKQKAASLPKTPAKADAKGARAKAPATAATGECLSKASTTPGCRMDCKNGQIVLKLTSVNGTAVIVAGDFAGTPVTITSPTEITFTINMQPKGIKNLNLQYAIASGDVGTLSEDCPAKTVWDNNVNNTALAVAYAVCS